MIELKEFAEAVEEMRKLQTKYFKEKSKPLLQQSMAAEKRVDNMLKQIGVAPAPEAQQTRLFG
ncbi:hypothetical protein GCM10028805_52290 [Spirosoma harenae]